MARCLLTVAQRYLLRGKGLMIVPGFVPVEGERIKTGDHVMVHRPDGMVLAVTIQGTSFAIEPGSANRVFLQLEVIDKQRIPIGSEIWSIDA